MNDQPPAIYKCPICYRWFIRGKVEGGVVATECHHDGDLEISDYEAT